MSNKIAMDELFWKIFNADNEEELNHIVTTHPLMADEKNWFPYGGQGESDRGNFGTFENQQPHPIPALVEKITNSIDSLLLKECRLSGIDPKSSLAPKSMQEAVEKFFKIKNGNFSEIGDVHRREIAEQIEIIATGDKSLPNLLIYDNGEGQHPDDFPRTFLSLHQNNKTDIHFVQGKYNMGSTGAVVFCGTHRYQLIGSKLFDGLNIQKRDNEFGFTLVRRHPLSEEQEVQYGSSWYEYFVVNKKIPRFSITELDLGLAAEKKFVSGSIVKLYSYQLPRGSRSDIRLDLWRDLNQYLYQPALPILTVERRYGDKRENQGKIVLGNKTRIIIDDREKKEKTISLTIQTKEIGSINIEATIFKHDVEQKEFIKDKALIFTLNGQIHGFLPRVFISQELGFSMLRDSLLIQIDCTNARTTFRQDLFMANRYNLKEGESLQILLDIITQALKSNDTLKELNQNRKDKILRDNANDDEILKSIIQSIPMDKDLLSLLRKGGNLDFFKAHRHPDYDDSQTHHVHKAPYVSKRFPSIFKLDIKAEKTGPRIKSIPLNGKGIIEFETDVEDEYLFRPHEKGEFQIQILGVQNNNTNGGTKKGKPRKVEDIFNVTIAGPNNNSIKIAFEPKGNLSVGDEIELNARLSSPYGNLESIFYIKIVDPQKQQEKHRNEKPQPPALPIPIRVFAKPENPSDKSWSDFHWTGDDIIKVVPSDESDNVVQAIAINMDSFAIKKYLSKNRINTENGIKFIKDKYFTSVYLHGLFLYGILDKMNKESDDPKSKVDVEEVIPMLMKPYSSLLLYENTNEIVLSNLKTE